MNVRINLVIDDGAPVELVTLERSELQAGNAGLQLDEVKSLLAATQKALLTAQTEAFAGQQQCSKCTKPLRSNGATSIVLRTLFGNSKLRSPRFFHCPCSINASRKKSFSPLAAILPERTTPEFQYLQAKWVALLPYGVTLNLLKEIFPLSEDLSKAALHRNARRIVQRLDREMGEELQPEAIAEDSPDSKSQQLEPFVVGIDGGYIHARGGTRKEGWFEVIVGKSFAPQGDKKCFGFVQRREMKPRRRLRDVLDAQGFLSAQPVVFLSDGGASVRALQMGMLPNAEHILDWFHITMRLTVMNNLAIGLEKTAQIPSGAQSAPSPRFTDDVASIKWNIWHGKVNEALEKVELLRTKLDTFSATSENRRKLFEKLSDFSKYIRLNQTFIPCYEKRKNAGKPFSTSFVESAVNQILAHRFAKKQQMRWTEQGCHHIVQLRTRVIDDELRPAMKRWYPGMQAPELGTSHTF